MTSSPTLTRTIGRYEVESELGRGAMGIVLLARDPVLERQVAIKYVRSDLKLSVEDRKSLMLRIRQEARAIARIAHPGIVSLHDLGESEEEGVYLVFERAEGPTLEAALRRGRLTPEGAARLAKELGEGLRAAHQRDVVHRDIKPGNIILTEEGAKVADFGVARLPESTLTKAGVRVGTPAYTAPEAIAAANHTPRSDQFSLAASLYEAISGRRAFPGDDAISVARSIETDDPLPIAAALGLTPRVDAVLLRGMAKRPEQRFASCASFGAALSEALTGSRPLQPTLPDQRTLLKHDRANRITAIGMAVLWTLIGASLGVLATRTFAPASSRTILDDAALSEPGSGSSPQPRPAYITPTPE